MFEIEGRRIDYQEQGAGRPIVFVPGSFSTPMAWRGIQKAMPAGYRFIATSLCGYGQTDESRGLGDIGMHHLTRVIDAVVLRAGAPVHLVGHSFGGTVAFAAALAGKAQIASIATFEANPMSILRGTSHAAMVDDAQAMSLAFEAAQRAGDPDAAARIIDFWGGAGAFAAMPEAVRSYCRATAGANVLDWRTAFDFSASPADYAKLTMPVLLVRGASANPVMVRITDALGAALPNSRTEVVVDAGHFLIASHAAECARLLSSFLADVTGRHDGGVG